MGVRRTRIVVGILGAVSAMIAGAIGAFALTRIAGDYLGFPEGLEWALTGAVDVAAIAGGVMWTAFTDRIRSGGRLMNMVCTAVSGIGVGLDHATNAGRVIAPGANTAPWPFFAFAIGLFIPLLFTWLLHTLALIGDQALSASPTGDEQDSDDRTAPMAPPASVPVPPERVETNTVPLAPERVETDAVPPAPEPARAFTPELVPHLRPVTGSAPPVRTSTPSSVGVTSAAREWLRKHWVPGMKPAALTAALAEQGVSIQRQTASKAMAWARDELGAQGTREEVSA